MSGAFYQKNARHPYPPFLP